MVQQPTSTSLPMVKLILLTYMRSGSTFTGDLFNQHPQVFYFYEPLWSFDFHFKKGEPALVFDGDSIQHNPIRPKQLSSLQKNTIKSVLGCDFRQINTEVYNTLKLPGMSYKSSSCGPYVQCIKTTPDTKGLLSCLSLLETACTSASLIITKTVRFAMEQAESLLKEDPQVKIVHLVRDPRGVLRSRITHVGLKYNETGKQLCTKVLRDLQVSERVKKKYPGRILTARYEDLADKPLDFSQRLLNFAGLQMTPNLRKYVWNITSSGWEVEEKATSTIRSDSRSTASNWRSITTIDFVARVDTCCLKLYDHMGYIPCDNKKKLKDPSTPVYKALSKDLSWLW